MMRVASTVVLYMVLIMTPLPSISIPTTKNVFTSSTPTTINNNNVSTSLTPTTFNNNNNIFAQDRTDQNDSLAILVNQLAILQLLNQYDCFSHEDGIADEHEVMDLREVKQQLNRVDEELPKIREHETTLQETLASLHHIQSNFAQNQILLQQNHFSIQKDQNNIQQSIATIEENILSLTSSVSELQDKVANLQEKQTMLEEGFSTVQQKLDSTVTIPDSFATHATLEQHNKSEDARFVHDGQQFYVHTENKLNWNDSRHWCQTHWDSDLAVPTGDIKQFKKLVIARDTPFTEPDGTQKGLWVGASDQEMEGQWLWINGNVISSDFAWGHPDQPNSWGGNQDCMGVRHNRNGLIYLNDNACENLQHFVCGRSQ